MKTLIIAVIGIFITTSLKAQTDDKRFCFEPVVGTFIPKVNYPNPLNVNLTNKSHYGYKFGFLKNIGIGQVFVIRPTIAVMAFKRESYLTDFRETSSPILFNNVLDLHSQASLHFSQNFTSGRAKTFLYLVQGVTFDFNMVNRDFAQDLWLEKSENITIDAGIGIRLYAKRKHVIAMEVLYSYGIMNLKSTDENINSTKISVNDAKYYGNQFNKINIHYITLQFLL